MEGEGYYDTLSRYIHLNPVRTQAAKALPVAERRRELAAFPWSSFPALIGLRATPEWLKTEGILNGFGATFQERAGGYRRYVEEGLLRDLADPGEAARVAVEDHPQGSPGAAGTGAAAGWHPLAGGGGGRGGGMCRAGTFALSA